MSEEWIQLEDEQGRIIDDTPDGDVIAKAQNPSFGKWFKVRRRTDNPWANIPGGDPEQPPVIPPPSPGINGRLRIGGGTFRDDSGPVLPLYCHFGEAFSRYMRDPDAVLAQLDRIKAAGYDGIRFWDVLGWWQPYWAGREVTPFSFVSREGCVVSATTTYYSSLGEFIDEAVSRGLRVHHSRGDCNGFSTDSTLRHVRNVWGLYGGASRRESCALFEGNNEDWQNGGFGPDVLSDAVRPARDAGILTALSAPPNSSEERDDLRAYQSGPMYYVHGHRGGRAADRLRHIFSLGYELPVARCGWQGEPIGPGSSVNSTSDPEELGLLAAMAWMSRQAWTYMSGAGVRWDEPIDEQPGFHTVAAVRAKLVEMGFGDVMTFQTLTHGGTGDARLISPTGYHVPGENNIQGPERIDQAIAGPGSPVVMAIIYGHAGDWVVRNVGPSVRLYVLKPTRTGVSVDDRGLIPGGGIFRVGYHTGRILLGIPA